MHLADPRATCVHQHECCWPWSTKLQKRRKRGLPLHLRNRALAAHFYSSHCHSTGKTRPVHIRSALTYKSWTHLSNRSTLDASAHRQLSQYNPLPHFLPLPDPLPAPLAPDAPPLPRLDTPCPRPPPAHTPPREAPSHESCDLDPHASCSASGLRFRAKY